MDRKEFLSTMFTIGGATLASTTSVKAFDAMDKAVAKRRKGSKLDPEKVVLLSDIHICGEFKDGKPAHYPYNPICLKQSIDKILKMKPLPGNVMVFGDIAWDYGLEEDYRYAAELLRPIQEAGIQLTLGMGNHDRRASFLKVFPEYKETTQVKNRVVSIVELPSVNIVLLDSLSEYPNLKPRQSTNVNGELDKVQAEWLAHYLETNKKPVILGAHHPINEMPILSTLVTKHSHVVGYIYGHCHLWDKLPRIIRPRVPQRMITTLGLPSTFYGDIGFAVLECCKDCVTVDFSSQGFWWPQPVENPPFEWKLREEDLAHEHCSFALPQE